MAYVYGLCISEIWSADGLNQIKGLKVDIDSVETNIVSN